MIGAGRGVSRVNIAKLRKLLARNNRKLIHINAGALPKSQSSIRFKEWGASMRSALHQEFPSPWAVEERPACFVVHDNASHPLAYIHFESKSDRQSPITELTRDEARRIAANIAKLPELLGNG